MIIHPLTVQAAGALLDRYRLAVLERHEHGDPAAGEDTVQSVALEIINAMTGGAAGDPADAMWPLHGVGSLGHGATPDCDILGGDNCNNGPCRQGLDHDRCTVECTALVVWDTRTGGSWQPDAPNLAGATAGDLIILADVIAQGGPQ